MVVARRLFGSALAYTLSNAIAAGVPVLLLPVLTRLLSPSEYGTVAMFSLVLGVMGALTGLSVHGAVGVRFFERERIDLPRYVASCLVVLGFSTVAMLLLSWVLLSPLEAVTKVPGRWILAAVAVSGAQFVLQLQLVLWQSARRPWSYAALRTGHAVADAGTSLILVLALGMAWQGRLGGIALATALTAVVALVAMRRSGWLQGAPQRAYVVDALRFGVPLIPHTIGTMLVLMADRFLISNVLDVESTGIYTVAMQLGMVLGLCTDAFNRAFAPWLMEALKHADPVRDRRIVRMTYAYFGAVVVLALAFAGAAPPLLSWLVGPRFQAASGALSYIAVGFAFGGMYYMVTNYVFFANRTAGLAGITLTSGLCNVALTYVLLTQNGMVGAAQAFMLSQAATFLATWWLAQRSHPMPWRRCLEPA